MFAATYFKTIVSDLYFGIKQASRKVTIGPASAALIQPVPALRCESALIPVTFGVLFFTPTWKLMRQEALYQWE